MSTRPGPIKHTVFVPAGTKDASGAHLPEPKETDPSIDELMRTGLLAIRRTINNVYQQSKCGMLPRESVTILKDCMAMLHELKANEAEILEGMDESQLKTVVDGN